MQLNIYPFQKQLAKNPNLEKYLVFGFLFLYVIVNLLFGLNEDATWDDDCPTRYYNTLNAFNEPKAFISVWNRPLFVLIFAPIVHLGKHSIFISMVIMTAIGGYFLYKGVKKKGIPNAFMVLPFLLFQTYFFSISRNPETEPISVTLLCLGFYFLANKKWLAFAIVGGLMPLARLELSVLLIFWGWYLLVEKQYKYILVLAVPVILWNIAGFIIEGDWAYVYNTTFGKENKTNRYGHTTFWHYFQRYIYVIGPVIYLFFIVGFVKKLRKFQLDFFLFWQMVAGFMLYVVFSWKLNMGNAAGFLRNLIPLTPLVALFALEGYNAIIDAFTTFFKKKEKATLEFVAPERTFKEVTPDVLKRYNAKKKESYETKRRSYERELKKAQREFKTKNSNSSGLASFIWVLLSLGFVILTTYIYHSLEIRSHHKLLEDTDYTNLYWILGTFALILIFLIISKLSTLKNATLATYGGAVGILALLFTGITEPPNKNMSPEREVMQDVSDFYVDSYLSEHTTYVNHIWFFWANDLDKYDTTQYKLVTIENLERANVGDICIYDTHYSHRLAGNVPKTWFAKRIDWVELDRNISENNGFHCTFYQKTDSTFVDCMAKINTFIETEPEKPLTYLSRGNLYKKQKKMDSAIVDYTRAIELDTTFFNSYMNRALVYFTKKDFDKAITDFHKASELNEKSHDAVHNIGACYANLQQKDSAIVYYNKSIKIKPDFAKAYQNKAKMLKSMGKIDEALATYNKVISMNIKNQQAILERAQIYFDKKEFSTCISDLSSAIKLNPKNAQAIFVRGICSQNLQQNDNACKDFQTAASLGHKQAPQYVAQYCNAKQ